MSIDPHKKAVLETWELLNGIEIGSTQPLIDQRAAEIKADLKRIIKEPA